MTTTIHTLSPADHDAWCALWHRYLGFHGIWPEDAPPDTWERLLDPASSMHGLRACIDGHLVGFAHYVVHPHPWQTRPVCWLADVFTAPETRRLGVATALVNAVFVRAAEVGAHHVYGTTLVGNTASHELYDQLAERLQLIVYRHDL